MFSKTLLVTLACIVTRLCDVAAQPAQSPLRFRLNKGLLEKIISIRDQEMFDSFKDVQIESGVNGNLNLTQCEKISYTLQPKGVAVEDWDLKMTIDSQQMGAETGEITVKGVANLLEGEPTEFEGTIKNVKYIYEMGKKFNE